MSNQVCRLCGAPGYDTVEVVWEQIGRPVRERGDKTDCSYVTIPANRVLRRLLVVCRRCAQQYYDGLPT